MIIIKAVNNLMPGPSEFWSESRDSVHMYKTRNKMRILYLESKNNFVAVRKIYRNKIIIWFEYFKMDPSIKLS